MAYRVAGRYEEAIVPLKKVLTLNPNSSAAHRLLAACYAELGREEEARAEVAEVLTAQSQFLSGVAEAKYSL